MFSKAIHYLKSDYRSIAIGIKLVVFVIFLRSLGWGFADPYFSIYLHQFQENYTLVGFFTSLIGIGSLFTILLLMRLMDRMREAVIIQDGELLYFFTLIGYMAAGIFRNVPLLLISLLVNGIAQTFVVVGTEAYIRKHNGKGKAGPFGYYTALDDLGWVIGMIFASLTIRYYNFNSMFLFVMPSIFASFFILPRLRERGFSSLIRGFRRYFRSGRDVVGDIARDIRSLNPKMTFFLLLSFFDGVIRMFSFVFIPLFGLSIDLDLESIALLMAVMYFPFVFSYFFSEISDRMSRMTSIAMGLFIGALSFILLFFIVHKVLVMVLAAVVSLSLAIIRPAYNAAITSLTPRRMLGEVTGLNNFVDRIGRIVGPIAIGFLSDTFSLQTAFLTVAAIAFGLCIASLMLRGYDFILNPAYDKKPNPNF